MSDAQSPVRWGIVGLGWATTDFVAPAMIKSAGSRLVACLGSSLDKGRVFANRFGVERVHGDLAALMRDPDLDAVYIALPNALHHAAVLAAASGKKHVLCEKPMALSIAHARDMVAACVTHLHSVCIRSCSDGVASRAVSRGPWPPISTQGTGKGWQ